MVNSRYTQCREESRRRVDSKIPMDSPHRMLSVRQVCLAAPDTIAPYRRANRRTCGCTLSTGNPIDWQPPPNPFNLQDLRRVANRSGRPSIGGDRRSKSWVARRSHPTEFATEDKRCGGLKGPKRLQDPSQKMGCEAPDLFGLVSKPVRPV